MKRQRLRLETIVVDNASTDGAAEMVGVEFPKVCLVRNIENAGYARACNQAAHRARGRWLFFLNNDTVVPRGALLRLVRRARVTPDLGLLGPQLRDGRGGVQRSVRARPSVSALCHRLTFLRWTGLFRGAHGGFRGEDPRDQPPRLAGQGGTGSSAHVRPYAAEVLMGAALLMPRRVWKRVGGWAEQYAFGGEDIDLCLRVANGGWQVLHDPTTAIVHLGRVASRRHPGFVHGKTLVGITRSLRTAGSPSWAIALYKLAFTVDIPLRMAVLAGRWTAARLSGKQKSANRTWLDLVGLTRFVCDDLLSFWRA